jgi:hypothetical protein
LTAVPLPLPSSRPWQILPDGLPENWTRSQVSEAMVLPPLNSAGSSSGGSGGGGGGSTSGGSTSRGNAAAAAGQPAPSS